MDQEMRKRCSRCDTVKLTTEFQIEKGRRGDGLSAWCRACGREYRRANGYNKRARLDKAMTPEKRECERAKERKRAKTRGRPQTTKAKESARRRVRHLVAKGLLTKPDRCNHCGEVTSKHRLHGHHQNYDEREIVEWLCSICHGKEHRHV